MKYLYKPRQCLAILLVMSVFMTGCNIFNFTTDVEKTPKEKAEEAMREGNYEEAKELLADSVKDSTDSYALYLDAKATLHAAEVDIIEIVELIEGQDAQGGGSLAILDLIDDFTDEKQTAWYQANMAVSANLAIISNQETTGPFKPDDIALDYTVSNLISGVIGIRDTNQDYVIDDNDFNLDLNFLETGITEGFNFDGGTFEDKSGEEQEFTGLEVFLGEYEAAAGKISGKKGYTPKDINKILGFVLHHLDKGTQGLISLLNKSETTFETEEIEKYLDEIAFIINYYWYNDGEDNDLDGLIDEEWIDGFDNDGDGLIDEDSDYTDPKIVLDPDYNWEDYFPDNIEDKDNVTDGETDEFRKIWEKWSNKQNR